jgi:hypothetical protein
VVWGQTKQKVSETSSQPSAAYSGTHLSPKSRQVAEIHSIVIPGQPMPKVHNPISVKKKLGVGGACLSSQLCQEAWNRRVMVQAGLGKTWDPISKIIRAKRAGGVAQAIECFLSKQKFWVQEKRWDQKELT